LNCLGTGWVLLSSMFQSVNKDRFVCWLSSQLLRRLNRGDVLVLDNLRARKAPRVVPLCGTYAVQVLYLPPYSPDFNPIEHGGPFRSSTCTGISRGTPPRCCASHAALGTASGLGIVASGSLMPGTGFSTGDHWGYY
jgi:hypothetical protein